MRNILSTPGLGTKYLNSDAEARGAFTAAGMDVPLDVKVVFLPAGDSGKLPLGSGSAIIELPPAGPGNPTDDKLNDLFLCTYHISW